MKKFRTFGDLQEWAKQMRTNKIDWPTCGRVCFHIYERQVLGGGVEFDLRFGTWQNEADVKAVETRPGFLTVAVVPCDKLSVDWPGRKAYTLDTPLKVLRKEFKHGRNIGLILDEICEE